MVHSVSKVVVGVVGAVLHSASEVVIEEAGDGELESAEVKSMINVTEAGTLRLLVMLIGGMVVC